MESSAQGNAMTNATASAVDRAPMATASGAPTGLGPNQVEVQPGGTIFKSIKEAIDSITNADQRNRYTIYLGPGTYNERVTMKPWTYIIGRGPEKTIITYHGSYLGDPKEATIVGASNAGLAGVAVKATYEEGVTSCNGICCDAAMNFNIANVSCLVEDHPSRAGSLMGIYNDFSSSSFGAPCDVIISNVDVIAFAAHPKSFATGIWAVSNGKYQVFNSKISVRGEYVATGIAANPSNNNNVTVNRSVVSGQQYCLQGISGSTLIANKCSLSGEVGENVVINN